MIIIGLCGAAGSGKGTAADALQGCGLLEMAFADAIYAAIANITGYSVIDLKDRTFKETAIPWLGGKSPRHLLQTLGTEWGRTMICDDIWVQATMRHIDSLRGVLTTGVVISDVRFDNEAVAIRARGGVVWEIRRPAAACLDEQAAKHASERGIDRALVDAVIVNDSTEESLKREIKAMFSRQYRAGTALSAG